MEPRDLNRMFDALAPTADQEQAVLDRLLQTERKGRPIRKLKKLTVVAIAAALMVISCAAAVVTGLDQRLIDYFGAGPEQAELLAFGAVPVDVTVKDNGATLHVTQVLMDRYYIMFLADFTAPEGTVLGGIMTRPCCCAGGRCWTGIVIFSTLRRDLRINFWIGQGNPLR